MQTKTLNVRKDEGSPARSYTMRFPSNIDEAIKTWGPENCFSLLASAATVRLQSVARGAMEAGKKPEEITTQLNGWKPTARAAGKPKHQRAAELLAALSPEERRALLAEVGNDGAKAKSPPAPDRPKAKK